MIIASTRRTLTNGATFVASERCEFTVGKTPKGGVGLMLRPLTGPLAGTAVRLYFGNREAIGELSYALTMAAGLFGDTHRAAAAARAPQAAAPAPAPKARRRRAAAAPAPVQHGSGCTCEQCEIPF